MHWLYMDEEIQQRKRAFEQAVYEKRKADLKDALSPIVASVVGILLALVLIWIVQ